MSLVAVKVISEESRMHTTSTVLVMVAHIDICLGAKAVVLLFVVIRYWCRVGAHKLMTHCVELTFNCAEVSPENN
jgi:hypothetical protein